MAETIKKSVENMTDKELAVELKKVQNRIAKDKKREAEFIEKAKEVREVKDIWFEIISNKLVEAGHNKLEKDISDLIMIKIKKEENELEKPPDILEEDEANEPPEAAGE